VFHDISILENGLFEEPTRADAGMEFVLRTWIDLGQCEHTFSPLWLSAAEHSHPYPATTCKKAENITRQGFDKVICDVKASKSKESHSAITLSAIEGALAKIAEEDEQLSRQNHEHMKIIAENGPIATALGYRVSSKVQNRQSLRAGVGDRSSSVFEARYVVFFESTIVIEHKRRFKVRTTWKDTRPWFDE